MFLLVKAIALVRVHSFHRYYITLLKNKQMPLPNKNYELRKPINNVNMIRYNQPSRLKSFSKNIPVDQIMKIKSDISKFCNSNRVLKIIIKDALIRRDS